MKKTFLVLLIASLCLLTGYGRKLPEFRLTVEYNNGDYQKISLFKESGSLRDYLYSSAFLTVETDDREGILAQFDASYFEKKDLLVVIVEKSPQTDVRLKSVKYFSDRVEVTMRVRIPRRDNDEIQFPAYYIEIDKTADTVTRAELIEDRRMR